MHRLMCEQFIDMLENGRPLLNKDGTPKLTEQGELIYRALTAQEFNVIRSFLADNGIDQEPIEGTAIEDLRKAAQPLPKFDDDEPLYIEERDGLKSKV